jgi:predicted DNA-binding transcriptional regulator AlpA
MLHRTTLSNVELVHGLINGTFPLPVPVSVARIGWRADDVDAWINARPWAISLAAVLSADIKDDSDWSVSDTDDTLH